MPDLSPAGPSAPSLAARLRLALLAAAVVQLLALLVAVALAVETRHEQRRLTEDYFRTVQDSHGGFVRALEMDSAATQYLRSGDQEFLAELRALQRQRQATATAEEIERRLRGNERALQSLAAARSAYVTWLEDVEALVQAVEAGGPSAVSPAQLEANQADFAEVSERYDAYLAEVAAVRDRAAGVVQKRSTWLFGAVVVSAVTALVTGALLYAALRRWVVAPVAALAAETRTVRQGSLDHSVRVEGPPEIVALADDVEAMRRGLVEQVAALEDAQALLHQQAEDLRRSNRDLEQFAYVASHDLQEPLRKVSSFCQMLERRYKGQLDERADQYIEFAVDGAKRMQLLINDLLMFSRVGRLSEGFGHVDMDDVIEEALRNLSVAVEESGALVSWDPLPTVRGERRLLVQLLQNLLGNAVKFRGAQPPQVRVEARRDGDMWEFAVSDNGIGIEPQYAERIFVIFQRLHAKADYEGTGIGLALCKKIVEHHGGTMWLDREAGPGACFRWTMPAREPAQREADAPPGVVDEAPDGAERETAWPTR